MKYEYGEPVEQSQYEPGSINQSDGMFFMWLSDDSRRHRIIACINVCAGLSNEDLEIMGLGGVAQILAERDQLKAHHELDNRVIAHLQGKLNERKTGSAGPTLTADQATNWEWTGEQPRKLRRGESGLCEPRHDSERPWIMRGCPTSESTSFYWPLRRRQTPKAEEPTIPQSATLNDIADMLQRILDRMPEREVE